MHNTTRKLRWWMVGLLILLPAFASAQDTASLTGTIRDASGAVIPRAEVVIKNTANGLTRNLFTNTDGEYLAPALPPGPYDIAVAVKGFRKYQAKDVTLRVAQTARIDVILQVGDINSEITVQGEGLAQVETQSSKPGGTYADLVGDPHSTPCPVVLDPNIKGPALFNSCAYEQTQGLTFGDSGRNSLNIPWRTNFDMSMYKSFKPMEKLDMQFRLEGFNVFNHTQWNGVSNYLGSGNFLLPRVAHTARVVQLGLKLIF